MGQHRRRRQKGSGQIVRPRVTGGTWGVRVAVIRNGKRSRRFKGGFATRELAERVLKEHEAKIAGGTTSMLSAERKSLPCLATFADPWLKRRELTHRAHSEDKLRWRKHLVPHFGHLRPDEVTHVSIRRFIEQKCAEGLNPATVRVLVAILSSLFADINDHRDGDPIPNPCIGLPKATRKLVKPTHDPKLVPFIENISDVERVIALLPEPLSVGYAIGALAGLRTGEVFALKWEHVDLPARRIHVRESVKGPLKDKDSRIVPVLDRLAPTLAAWKLKSGGKGLVVPPLRCDGGTVDKHTPGRYLRPVLTKLGLHALAQDRKPWYCATRHTFASQWAMAGGSIFKLQQILGHSSITITERYAHLHPHLFTDEDLATLTAKPKKKHSPKPPGPKRGKPRQPDA